VTNYNWFFNFICFNVSRDGVKKLLEDNPELSAELEAKLMEQIKV
jgi:uncharacterized protein YneF (UPF0154 family)